MLKLYTMRVFLSWKGSRSCMYLGPAHRKSRYRQLMARVGRGDDIIGHFSTLLSVNEKGQGSNTGIHNKTNNHPSVCCK